MGKYHPHGDGVIYDALVRMAQDFSLRHPLIDGHGNFGSPDFGAAASRYTECRLAPLAMQMLDGINEDTVDFADNYSGDETEPSRSEEHTSELQSLMRISYAVFCLKKKNTKLHTHTTTN